MYEFPYGGEQQLNLNWIINEIITLHKRLDPDYELPNFDNAFPYMNLNQLNLDWILRELKAIKDLAPTEDSQLLKMVANALIANTYDAETQYNVDDIVYRDNDNRLYKCVTATPAGGEPFDSSKWVEVDVGGVLTDLLNGFEPYDGTPSMNGTASAGTSTQYARGDHVHPKDTARVPTTRTVNGKALSSNITLNASDIPNDSNVAGDNTDDALNNLDDAIGDEETARKNVDTATQSAIAIVADGNIHAAITSGQFVYVKNHSTLTEGLYRATAAVPANDPLTTANVTAISNGGYNELTKYEIITPVRNETNVSSSNYSVICRTFGDLVFVIGTIRLAASVTTNSVLVSGLPIPLFQPQILGMVLYDYASPPDTSVYGKPFRLNINSSGQLVPWYNPASLTYLQRAGILLNFYIVYPMLH